MTFCSFGGNSSDRTPASTIVASFAKGPHHFRDGEDVRLSVLHFERNGSVPSEVRFLTHFSAYQ